MAHRIRFQLWCLGLALLASTGWGQTQLAPAWQPVAPPSPPATTTAAKPTDPTKTPNASPYYRDAVIYSGPMHAPVMTAPAVSAAGNPTAGSQPLVAMNPTMPVVQSVSTATRWPTSIPMTPAATTTTFPQQPVQVMSTAPFGAQVSVQAKPAEPFGDPTRVAADGRHWREYDIASYTSRFPPTSQPENAVRDWILAETGLDTWHSGEVAALNVAPDRVKVYHDARVQSQTADVLGRLLYFQPGQFDCKVRILKPVSSNWRRQVDPALRQAVGGNREDAWIVRKADGDWLVRELVDRHHAKVLSDPSFVVGNGQPAQLKWTADRAGDSDIQVWFSPLIGADAAGIDLRTRVDWENGPVNQQSDLVEGERFSLPANTQLVLLLRPGMVARPRWLRIFTPRQGREEDILIVLDIRPNRGNTVNGAPVVSMKPNHAWRDEYDQEDRRYRPEPRLTPEPMDFLLPPY